MVNQSFLRGLALAIGLGANVVPVTAMAAVPALPPSIPAGQHRLFGVLTTTRGTGLMLRLRNGRLLDVDAAEAFAEGRVSEPLFAGKPTVVEGTFGPAGLFHALTVRRAAPRPSSWGADR